MWSRSFDEINDYLQTKRINIMWAAFESHINFSDCKKVFDLCTKLLEMRVGSLAEFKHYLSRRIRESQNTVEKSILMECFDFSFVKPNHEEVKMVEPIPESLAVEG